MAKPSPFKLSSPEADQLGRFERPMPQTPTQVAAATLEIGPQQAIVNARVPDHPIAKGADPKAVSGEANYPAKADVVVPFANMKTGR